MSTKRCGFNLSVSISLPNEGIWLNADDPEEIEIWINRYLKNIKVFSEEIGDLLSDYGAETNVQEVRFWKDE